MKKTNRISAWYKKLRTGDKIMIISALVMSLVVIIAVPTFAWFSYQKKMATMAKINSPAKLSLRSGAGEDIIQFKMSGIDTESGHYKDFVFCVEGEDISQYSIQIAHTTNINFSYSIYQANPDANYDPDTDTGGVLYVTVDRDDVYYIPADSALTGNYINKKNDATYTINGSSVTRTIGDTNYEKPSYNNGGSADERQKFAEPLYWQSSAVTADETSYDEDDTERAFQNYYVLRVSWGSDVRNDKETDLIYITAQVS